MNTSPERHTEAKLRLARRMSRMSPNAVREILKVAERPDVLSFAGGLPAPELFPVQAIADAHAEVLAHEQHGRAALQYSVTEGYGPLREWVVARLAKRGMRITVDEVLITSGSQQGIDLTARILLDPGDRVALENPSYLAAIQTFSGCEATFLGVPSDDQGMQIDALEELAKKTPPKLIYVVAEFHNPKGTTLARERRERLVRFAQSHRIPILEDDPYGELRFRGEAPPPLAAIDGGNVVIQLGTFSKTLAPGLRLGWLVGPKELVRAATIAKQAADLHTATLTQRAVATLLSRFDYDAHLATIRKVYGERCDAMLRALERHLPAGTRWTRPDGGLFIWAQLPGGLDADAVFAAAVKEKVAFVPGSVFYANDAPPRDFFRLNYSNRPAELIDEGIARIGRVVKEHLD